MQLVVSPVPHLPPPACSLLAEVPGVLAAERLTRRLRPDLQQAATLGTLSLARAGQIRGCHVMSCHVMSCQVMSSFSPPACLTGRNDAQTTGVSPGAFSPVTASSPGGERKPLPAQVANLHHSLLSPGAQGLVVSKKRGGINL